MLFRRDLERPAVAAVLEQVDGVGAALQRPREDQVLAQPGAFGQQARMCHDDTADSRSTRASR